MGRRKKYFSEEEIKEANKKKCRKWKNKNKEHISNYSKQYFKTPMGRASSLLSAYNNSDIKANRGEGDLTAKWIVENIFTKPCAHCGKEGWQIIGCNRIDNDKPHRKDNVEPCCGKCNCALSGRPQKRVFKIDQKTNEVVHIWESMSAAAEALGLSKATMSRLCNGKIYEGCIYKYEH